MRKRMKVNLYAEKWTCFNVEDEPELRCSHVELKSDGDRVLRLLDTKTIVFEVADDWDQNFNNEQIESLKLKKANIFAEADNRARQIDEKIQSLLAIEGKSNDSAK